MRVDVPAERPMRAQDILDWLATPTGLAASSALVVTASALAVSSSSKRAADEAPIANVPGETAVVHTAQMSAGLLQRVVGLNESVSRLLRPVSEMLSSPFTRQSAPAPLEEVLEVIAQNSPEQERFAREVVSYGNILTTSQLIKALAGLFLFSMIPLTSNSVMRNSQTTIQLLQNPAMGIALQTVMPQYQNASLLSGGISPASLLDIQYGSKHGPFLMQPPPPDLLEEPNLSMDWKKFAKETVSRRPAPAKPLHISNKPPIGRPTPPIGRPAPAKPLHISNKPPIGRPTPAKPLDISAKAREVTDLMRTKPKQQLKSSLSPPVWHGLQRKYAYRPLAAEYQGSLYKPMIEAASSGNDIFQLQSSDWERDIQESWKGLFQDNGFLPEESSISDRATESIQLDRILLDMEKLNHRFILNSGNTPYEQLITELADQIATRHRSSALSILNDKPATSLVERNDDPDASLMDFFDDKLSRAIIFNFSQLSEKDAESRKEALVPYLLCVDALADYANRYAPSGKDALAEIASKTKHVLQTFIEFPNQELTRQRQLQVSQTFPPPQTWGGLDLGHNFVTTREHFRTIIAAHYPMFEHAVFREFLNIYVRFFIQPNGCAREMAKYIDNLVQTEEGRQQLDYVFNTLVPSEMAIAIYQDNLPDEPFYPDRRYATDIYSNMADALLLFVAKHKAYNTEIDPIREYAQGLKGVIQHFLTSTSTRHTDPTYIQLSDKYDDPELAAFPIQYANMNEDLHLLYLEHLNAPTECIRNMAAYFEDVSGKEDGALLLMGYFEDYLPKKIAFDDWANRGLSASVRVASQNNYWRIADAMMQFSSSSYLNPDSASKVFSYAQRARAVIESSTKRGG